MACTVVQYSCMNDLDRLICLYYGTVLTTNSVRTTVHIMVHYQRSPPAVLLVWVHVSYEQQCNMVPLQRRSGLMWYRVTVDYITCSCTYSYRQLLYHLMSYSASHTVQYSSTTEVGVYGQQPYALEMSSIPDQPFAERFHNRGRTSYNFQYCEISQQIAKVKFTH